MKIEWKPEYNTHYPEIDGQHQHLIALMNELALTIELKKTGTYVEKTLHHIASELDDYVTVHLTAEEALFKAHQLNAVHHLALHDEFRNRLAYNRSILNNTSNQDLSHLLGVYKDLFLWYVQHIQIDDRQIFEEMNRGSKH